MKRFLGHLQQNFKLVDDNIRKFGSRWRTYRSLSPADLWKRRGQVIKYQISAGELRSETILDRKTSEFKGKKYFSLVTGWAQQQLLHLEISVIRINPRKGSSHLPLPKVIEVKKAVLNIINEVQKCFMVTFGFPSFIWSASTCTNRVANHLPFGNELKFTCMEFLVKFRDISLVFLSMCMGWKKFSKIVEIALGLLVPYNSLSVIERPDSHVMIGWWLLGIFFNWAKIKTSSRTWL